MSEAKQRSQLVENLQRKAQEKADRKKSTGGPMLVLTRKINESIIIAGGTPDEIKITLLDIGSGSRQGKIGIDAPNHISVNRQEIQAKIDKERLAK